MKTEKQLVRAGFSRAAPHYDALAGFQREAGERLLSVCQPEAAPLRVLDAGCGTGHGLRLIGQHWPAAEIIALDFAAPMLRLLPPGTPTQAVCGDIEALPLADACVDLVWSSLAMQWCDAGRAIGEFRRVLREGGSLAATTLGPATFAELRSAFVGVDGFRHTSDFIEEEALRAAISATGLDLIRLQRIEVQRHFPDLRALLASVRELGASHVASRHRRPGLMGKSSWRRFADNYERLRTARGLPLTYDTYFILACRRGKP